MSGVVNSVQQKLGEMTMDTKGSGDLGSRKYIKYSKDVETIPEGEAEDIQAVADMINESQKGKSVPL